MQVVKDWLSRRFSNPQVLILVLMLALGIIFIMLFGAPLAPFFAALVIAYLLEGVVTRLQRLGVPRLASVCGVFLLFIATLFFLFLGVVPLLTSQVTQFVGQLPAYVIRFQEAMNGLPARYPELVNQDQIDQILETAGDEIGLLGQTALTQTIASLSGLVTWIIFLILVPVLVFFMLKDKDRILAWLRQFLPKDRKLTLGVWREVDVQIGNYVRGKTIEILLVGAVSLVSFSILDLKYALLLSTLVGLSVLIPYIGAAVVTLPVMIVGFGQFGWTSEFAAVFFTYMAIQILDGNALVPYLFSEVVNIHPVAIIVAILFFGGIWGFWGIFFAIPLATLCHAVIRAIRADGEGTAGVIIDSTASSGAPPADPTS